MKTFLSAMLPTVRSIRARPSYFLVSVLVLGVSIAAQLAIFAVVEALILAPPSARQPAQLAFVQSSLPGGSVSYPDFRDIQERSTSFSGMFAYYSSNYAALTVNEELVTVRCGVVTGDYFATLGSPVSAGRLIEATDDIENTTPVAVISHELSRRVGLTVGSSIKINTFPFLVVGILQSGYRGIERLNPPDLWIPANQLAAVSPRSLLKNRGAQPILVGGRLKPLITLNDADSELAVIAQVLQAENPKLNYGMKLRVRSFASLRYSLDGVARIAVLLGGLVGFLFALAFTNFFALTLLRLLERRRELAVKIALGATPARLGRALLGELLGIAISAFAVGSVLGWLLLNFLQRDLRVRSLNTIASVHIDFSALGIVAGAVLVCAFIVWLLVQRSAGRLDVLSAIKESAAAPRRKTAFLALFAIQLAIALFLSATAVAFVDTLQTLAKRDYPFRTKNLLLFDVNFRNLGLANERVVTAEKFLARLRGVPGVTAVGGASASPLRGTSWTNMIVDGRDPSLEPDKGLANMTVVTGDYFSAAGIRLLSGRATEAREILGNLKSVVINDAAARRYWPDRDPIGQTIKAWEGGATYTIVGVADDVPTDRSEKILPHLYLPWGQTSSVALTFYLSIESDSAAFRQTIATELGGLWPYRNTPTLRSVNDELNAASSDLAFATRVIFLVAGFATLVNGCGLYFFSTYTAVQTIKDSAIRQALGARRIDLFMAHVAHYRTGLLLGIGLGSALLLGARSLSSHLGIDSLPVSLKHVTPAAAILLPICIFGLLVPLCKVLRPNLSALLSRTD